MEITAMEGSQEDSNDANEVAECAEDSQSQLGSSNGAAEEESHARLDLVRTARDFLVHPQAQEASNAQKLDFLRSKGLTDQEISQSFAAAGLKSPFQAVYEDHNKVLKSKEPKDVGKAELSWPRALAWGSTVVCGGIATGIAFKKGALQSWWGPWVMNIREKLPIQRLNFSQSSRESVEAVNLTESSATDAVDNASANTASTDSQVAALSRQISALNDSIGCFNSVCGKLTESVTILSNSLEASTSSVAPLSTIADRRRDDPSVLESPPEQLKAALEDIHSALKAVSSTRVTDREGDSLHANSSSVHARQGIQTSALDLNNFEDSQSASPRTAIGSSQKVLNGTISSCMHHQQNNSNEPNVTQSINVPDSFGQGMPKPSSKYQEVVRMLTSGAGFDDVQQIDDSPLSREAFVSKSEHGIRKPWETNLSGKDSRSMPDVDQNDDED